MNVRSENCKASGGKMAVRASGELKEIYRKQRMRLNVKRLTISQPGEGFGA